MFLKNHSQRIFSRNFRLQSQLRECSGCRSREDFFLLLKLVNVWLFPNSKCTTDFENSRDVQIYGNARSGLFGEQQGGRRVVVDERGCASAVQRLEVVRLILLHLELHLDVPLFGVNCSNISGAGDIPELSGRTKLFDDFLGELQVLGAHVWLGIWTESVGRAFLELGHVKN